MIFHYTATCVMSGLLGLMGSTVAMYEIYQHLKHYTHPTYQRYIVRLIFMVPVYALASWLSIINRKNQVYYDTLRDCYEAWVVYNFLALCMAYVGGPGMVVLHMEGQVVKPSWWVFTCCFPSIPINGLFLRRIKQGALQFVFIKPVLAAITLLLEGKGLYGTDEIRTDKGFLWVMVVYNLSYTCALYSLLFFYLGAQDLLKPFKPVSKFLIVKTVVFMTFWQGMLLSALVVSGRIERSEDAKTLQNVLICAEMVPAALMMLVAFPHTDYVTPDHEGFGTRVNNAGLRANVGHAISIHDVVSDTVHQFAPAYTDYVLYSDGSSGGPRAVSRHRTRTFVIMGQEMTNPRTPGSKKGALGGNSGENDCMPLHLGPIMDSAEELQSPGASDSATKPPDSPREPPLDSPAPSSLVSLAGISPALVPSERGGTPEAEGSLFRAEYSPTRGLMGVKNAVGSPEGSRQRSHTSSGSSSSLVADATQEVDVEVLVDNLR